MKLATYRKGDKFSCGVVTENGLVDIPQSWDGSNPPRSVKEILKLGADWMRWVREHTGNSEKVVDLEGVQLCAPVYKPEKLLALAGNYSEHIKEAGLSLGLSESPRETTVPRPFIMPGTALAGPDDAVPWPLYSEDVDYELELAVVVSRVTRGVTPDEASDCIAGYCIANDVSARSVTFAAGRDKRPWDEYFDWLNGKWSDGFLPTGPYLVTADEIDDPMDLDMKLWVNGDLRQDANTGQMIFSPEEIVSFLSQIMTLGPGDIICTGTPHGVGKATGKMLKPGDVVEAEIEGLGRLRNTVGPMPERFYKPLVK